MYMHTLQNTVNLKTPFNNSSVQQVYCMFYQSRCMLQWVNDDAFTRDMSYNIAQFINPTSISSSPFYNCATRSYLTYITTTQYIHVCRYTVPFSSASFIRKSAALSFTEPPQLRNSALTKISQSEYIDKTEYDITAMHYTHKLAQML